LAQLRDEKFVMNEFVEDDRGLLGWKITRKASGGAKTEEIFYTEELVATILKYGKQLSEI
jgi:hypothetical protein